jgi:phage terminase small subunit
VPKPLDPATPLKPDGLTADQEQILTLHWQGHTNEEIAEQLGTKTGTVTRFVNSPRCRVLVDRLRLRAARRADQRIARILDELDKIAFLDQSSIYAEDGSIKPFRDWSPEARAALNGFEVSEIFAGRGDERQPVGRLNKVKFLSKLDAINLLMQHHAMLKTRVEHTGPDGGPISILHDVDPQTLKNLNDAELAQLYREAVAPPKGAG